MWIMGSERVNRVGVDSLFKFGKQVLRVFPQLTLCFILLFTIPLEFLIIGNIFVRGGYLTIHNLNLSATEIEIRAVLVKTWS